MTDSLRLRDLSEEVELEAAPAQGIGVIAPFDFGLDREYWEAIPPGVSLHITRTPAMDPEVGVEMALRLADEGRLTAATRELLMARPAVTVLACTSASFVAGLAGEQRIRETMQRAGAERALTTSGALLEAIRELAIQRLAVATPYDRGTTAQLVTFLEEAGIGVVSCAFLGLRGDIVRVSADSVLRLVSETDLPEADAVFISCTNLRTRDVLGKAELQLQKPVLSANQVTMWAALKLVGMGSRLSGMNPASAPR